METILIIILLVIIILLNIVKKSMLEMMIDICINAFRRI